MADQITLRTGTNSTLQTLLWITRGSPAVVLSSFLWVLLFHYISPSIPWAHHSLVCLKMGPMLVVLWLLLDKHRKSTTHPHPRKGERDIPTHFTSRWSQNSIRSCFFHSNIWWMSAMCQGLCLGLRFKGKNRHRHNLLRTLTGEGSRRAVTR